MQLGNFPLNTESKNVFYKVLNHYWSSGYSIHINVLLPLTDPSLLLLTLLHYHCLSPEEPESQRSFSSLGDSDLL